MEKREENSYAVEAIETRIAKFETEFQNGLMYPEEETKKLEKYIINVSAVGKLSDETIKSYMDRVKAIQANAVEDEKFVEKVSPQAIPMSAEAVETIKANSKSSSKRNKIASVLAGTVAFIAVSATAVSCATNTKDNDHVATETTIDTEDENILPEEVEYTEMDAEYKELADNMVISMNDWIAKGLPVTEENKELLTKKYVEYYMLNKMDTLTDEQLANVFQNSTITAEDIMNAKFDFEWIDEQRVTVGTKDMMLDYNLMFEGSDAALLNDAATILDKVKTTKGLERKQAINEFKDYVQNTLGTNNARMQYSERALDTFRAVYFDAFDELTNQTEIDAELEHTINTTITCSLNKSDLDVEDATIQSLQSEFETYETQKLSLRLQNGWMYVANNEVNPYNDIEQITKYVAENIDLSLYNELPNYEEFLNSMFLVDAPKHPNDSGISNGKGGNIDQSDLDRTGTDNQEDYEDAIENEDEEKSNESETTTDNAGNEVEDAAMLAHYTQLGAADYYNGTYNEAKVPEQYRSAYRNGRDIAKAAEEEAKKENETTDEFVPVENGGETITETTETENYHEQITNNNQTSNTFVPVEDGEEFTTETIETEGYTRNYYSFEESDLQALEAFKNELQAIIDENDMTEDYTDSNTLTKQR